MNKHYTRLTCSCCRTRKDREEFEESSRRGPRRCLECLANNDAPQVSQRAPRQKVFNSGVSDISHNRAVVKAFMICVDG